MQLKMHQVSRTALAKQVETFNSTVSRTALAKQVEIFNSTYMLDTGAIARECIVLQKLYNFFFDVMTGLITSPE